MLLVHYYDIYYMKKGLTVYIYIYIYIYIIFIFLFIYIFELLAIAGGIAGVKTTSRTDAHYAQTPIVSGGERSL